MHVLSIASLEQRKLTYESNYKAWGFPQLTLEEYISRELTLLTSCFAKTMNCYILTTPTDPNSILSSCEVYSRPCVIGKDGQVGEGTAFSIASVFTPEPQRHKGYASEMMKKVSELNPLHVCSTLYSDIGKHFYARFGWESHSSISTIFDVLSNQSNVNVKDEILIDENDVIDIVQSDVLQLKTDIQTASLISPNVDIICILPTFEAYSWHFERSKFYAIHFKLAIPTVWGVRRENEFCIWAHDFKEMQLNVLRLVSSPATINAFIENAIAEAWKYGLKRVVVWDPKEYLVGMANAVTSERAHSISSLKSNNSDRKVVWFANEKFAWV